MAAIAAGALERSGLPGSALTGVPISTTGSAVLNAAAAAAGSTTAMPRSGASCRARRAMNFRIGEQVEGRQIELDAPAPGGDRDVGSDPGRLAQRQRQRRWHG